MQTENLIQGSPEWLAYRREHFNASDAPAMMGVHPTVTRNQLLQELHSGISREFSDYVQENVIDPGHHFEELCRPLAEKFMGKRLYRVTGSLGKLSASYDGLELLETEGWEHKRLNEALRAAFADMETIAPEHREQASGRCLPIYHRVQMEQQILVGELKRVLFSASDWDADGNLLEVVHVWYYPDPELRAKILAGWEQFEADLAAFVPPAPAEPKPIGRTPGNLPALRIEVTGMVTASNLAEYREHALAVLGDINRDLKTDQDFATAEATVKWCGDVESRLEAAKQHALSQTASIDELFRTVDEISAEAHRVRLELDKLVKARKDQIRIEMVQAGQKALADHIAALNASLGKPYMPQVAADFAGAIKGKRTIDSLRNAVDTLLASSKIEADAIGRRISTNLNTLRDLAADHRALFPDTAQIVLKQPEDLTSLVKTRIAEHQAEIARQVQAEREAQERREAAARAEAERKAEAERVQAEQRAAAEQGRQEAEAAAAARRQAEDEERAAVAAAVQVVENNGPDSLASHFPANVGTPVFTDEVTSAAPAPAANVVPLARPAPVVTSAAPTLRLGEINTRLGVFSITADGLRALGFEIVAKDRAACLYRESDWPHMLAAMVKHLQAVQAKQAA